MELVEFEHICIPNNCNVVTVARAWSNIITSTRGNN